MSKMLSEISVEDFIKALSDYRSNPENLTGEEKEHLADLNFLRKARRLVEKLVSAAITGFLWITLLSTIYFFVDKILFKR